jgi:3D-(3,5/4)-trihydroxycyclohexane-1,2-dione acylhydrolase (decyclizing)
VDLAANAASLGARVYRADTIARFREAMQSARADTVTAVIVVPVDRDARVAGYESWWDVPIAEVSTEPAVARARALYEEARRKGRDFL